MLFNILFTVFVLFVAAAVLSVAFTFAELIDAIIPFRATAAFIGWLAVGVFGLSAFNITELFNIPIYGVPWPYLVAFGIMLTPPINKFKITSVAVVLSAVVFILKIYWKYQS